MARYKADVRISHYTIKSMSIRELEKLVRRDLSQSIAEAINDDIEVYAEEGEEFHGKVFSADVDVTNNEVRFVSTADFSVTDSFTYLSDGNMGAMWAVKAIFPYPEAVSRLMDKDVKGDTLYMLWNDCCGQNVLLLRKVLASADQYLDARIEECKTMGRAPMIKEEDIPDGLGNKSGS